MQSFSHINSHGTTLESPKKRGVLFLEYIMLTITCNIALRNPRGHKTACRLYLGVDDGAQKQQAKSNQLNEGAGDAPRFPNLASSNMGIKQHKIDSPHLQ